jgi:long-chain acyl-CoA synthetase
MGRYLGIERLDQDTLASLTQHTLPQILAVQAERFGQERIAIREKSYGIWQTYSWEDYIRYVKCAGLGLMALGLKREDHVAIVTDNHPEWLFSELGGQAVGAVTINLFTAALAGELRSVLNRIQAAYVVAQDQEQVDKLLDARKKLPHVRRVSWRLAESWTKNILNVLSRSCGRAGLMKSH